jgi:hypothetical protein
LAFALLKPVRPTVQKEDSMTSRFASLTATGMATVLLLAGSAHGFTTKTRLCIQAAQAARKTCSKQCVEDFRGTFASCFGPGASCAQSCISEQAACQLDPSTAQTACQRDTPLPGGSGACNTVLRSSLEDCTSAPDPAGCATAARIAAIECNADCQLAFAPLLDVCNVNFRDCLQACASQR